LVDAIHLDLIREHGGLQGVRDEDLLESALARPRQLWHYEKAGIEALAASYAFGISRNHPLNDGNKRVAFVVMAVFLGLNGLDITASEEEVVAAMLSLAGGELSEEALEEWVRTHTRSR
jgi:death-on-curing protein